MHLKLSSKYAVVLAVLLIGICLRFYELEFQSFWFDEAASVHLASQGFPYDFFGAIQGDVHPPLYYFFLKLWMKCFGSSDFTVRAFSAILSSLGLLLFAVTAIRILPLGGALFSISLFAFSSYQLWYAQEARAYALAAFLGAVLLNLIFRFISNPSWKIALSNGIVAALLLYTIYLSALFLLAEFVALAAVLWFRRASWEVARRFIWYAVFSVIVAIILLLPWANAAVSQFKEVSRSYWIASPLFRELGSLYVKYLCYDLSWRRGALLFFLLGFGCMFLLECIINGKHTKAERDSLTRADTENGLILASLTVLPPVIAFGYSLAAPSIFLPRGLILSSLPFYLFLGWATSIVQSFSLRCVLRSILLGVCCLSYPNMWLHLGKDNWRDSAKYVSENYQSGDSFVFDAPGVELPFERYFERPLPSVMRIEDIPRSDRVWLVKAMSRKRTSKMIQSLEAKGYALRSKYSVLGVVVILFEKGPVESPLRP